MTARGTVLEVSDLHAGDISALPLSVAAAAHPAGFNSPPPKHPRSRLNATPAVSGAAVSSVSQPGLVAASPGVGSAVRSKPRRSRLATIEGAAPTAIINAPESGLEANAGTTGDVVSTVHEGVNPFTTPPATPRRKPKQQLQQQTPGVAAGGDATAANRSVNASASKATHRKSASAVTMSPVTGPVTTAGTGTLLRSSSTADTSFAQNNVAAAANNNTHSAKMGDDSKTSEGHDGNVPYCAYLSVPVPTDA